VIGQGHFGGPSPGAPLPWPTVLVALGIAFDAWLAGDGVVAA
jgi:hypothetical protein